MIGGGPRSGSAARLLVCGLLLVACWPGPARAQDRLSVLDVPFVSQSELLCGGAAAAMVLRYWGARGLTAESFAHLVDRSKAGIRTTSLVGALVERGWTATATRGSRDRLTGELARGRPVLALIQDRPGTFHYIVAVGVTASGVIFHDPARTPFRVMSQAEFSTRWDAADRWMAVVVPGPATTDVSSVVPPVGSPLDPTATAGAGASDSCERLVADGVRHAQANDLPAAERTLTSALACSGSAPLRELAGVRVLQQRWPDATDLAAAAVAEDPRDAFAWRLLATGRFLQDDRASALEAWNAVGEPRVDLVRLDGLTRTRPRVVESLLGIEPGSVLTAGTLLRARRRLTELPVATGTSLTYVPVPGGLAEVHATISERPLVPSRAIDYTAIGVGAIATRELKVATGSLAGGGERLAVEWRYWPGRPRLAVEMQAPAPWRRMRGVWGVGGFVETQPFDDPSVPTSERRGLRVNVADWATAHVRWTARAGVDEWKGRGAFGVVGGGIRVASSADHVVGRVDMDAWAGDQAFAVGHALVTARSSVDRRGWILVGTAGAGLAAGSTPADLWFAGDTGRARPVLLRAHPVVGHGRLRVTRLGRAVVHGSAEAQHWWRVPVVRLGVAMFADAVHLDRRVDPQARREVDVGSGLRVTVPGLGGVLRADVAMGLRDGVSKLSFVYEP